MLATSFTDTFTLTVLASSLFLIMFHDHTRFGDLFSWFLPPDEWNYPCCLIFLTLLFYCLSASAFYQLGLTIDRLVSVAAPTKSKTLLTRRRGCTMLITIVLMAMVTPVMFTANLIWKDAGCVMRSVEFFNNVQSPTEFYTRLVLVVCLLAGSIAIVGILAARRHQAVTGNSTRDRKLLRLSAILLSMNAAYFVTNTPLYLLLWIHPEATFNSPVYSQSQVTALYFYCLLFMNNAVNWIFYFFGGSFRQAFLHQFWRQNRVADAEMMIRNSANN
jgi:hypothetical protein